MQRLQQIGFFALVALALAGCGTTTTQSPPKVTASPLQQWNEEYAATFTSDAEAIIATQDQMQTDVSDGYNEVQWTSDCQQSQTDITSMQSIPAIPNTGIASDIASGLSDLATAAQDCLTAISDYAAASGTFTTPPATVSLLLNAQSETTAADTQFSAAASELSSYDQQLELQTNSLSSLPGGSSS